MPLAPQEPAVWFPAVRAGTGADVFTERLSEGLQRRGLRAEITWLPHRTEYAPWMVPVPKPPSWANIVHVNTWVHRRFLPKGLPIVATMHHCVHDPALNLYKHPAQALYHRLWIWRLEGAVLAQANHVVADSRYTAERTCEAFGIKDIEVVYIGIDLNGVFQALSNRKPHRPFRLLYIGKWSLRKGVDLLAPIMQSLGPDFELRYISVVKGNASVRSMPPNTCLIEPPLSESQIASAYQDADALLFPTRLEGFGLVALEAQACGLPVIATHGSSIPEVVEDGVTGILCSPNDIQDFTAAARLLFGDHDLWQRMCVASRTRVEKRFSLNAMVDRYLEIYNNIALMYIDNKK